MLLCEMEIHVANSGYCVVRLGCFTCRLRRKKCDEKHPSCSACNNLCVTCEYKRPIWWGNPEQRRIQKEHIKNKIKQTKMNERNGSITGKSLGPSLIYYCQQTC